MKRDYYFTVETLESGQRRKGANTVYRFLIYDHSPQPHPESVVKKFCTGVVRPAVDHEKMKNAYECKITKFESLAGNTWAYETEELSTD